MNMCLPCINLLQWEASHLERVSHPLLHLRERPWYKKGANCDGVLPVVLRDCSEKISKQFYLFYNLFVTMMYMSLFTLYQSFEHFIIN